jgi:hypothetical protein
MILITVTIFIIKDGTNNMFEVKRKTHLALTYSN